MDIKRYFIIFDSMKKRKVVVYHVFTRLFGNDNVNNKPWGTLEENGVGKFNNFPDLALQEIKKLGVTHIWYTGVLHHAMITDYTKYGISNDHPDIVKGRAGSPYAVKDYYQVDPDLAVDPSKRMEEFEQLIERTHKVGMKVLIDIVPNHVARKYEGKNNSEGISDFGANDDQSVVYKKHNNFYYVIGEKFRTPEWRDGYLPLGGEDISKFGEYDEFPAKWTGNGSRLAQPDYFDWYETVKINYGVSPEGVKDFEELPEGYDKKTAEEHFNFWKDKEVPDSWNKFKDIALFWLDKGVDGFRYDMAEMVPVEFWSFMNSSIKMKKPDAFLLAEVYNPDLYRPFIHLGKMDYLYDKVAFYDSLKHIMKGYGWTDHLPVVLDEMTDIEHHMLHFLENHDEQRIPCDDFAGSAEKGKPAMVVSALITTSPTLIYFGQEVGESAIEKAGFGSPTRTSIFDYIGVPHHQRWLNHKKFDGGLLSKKEKSLRDFYQRLLNFTINSNALMGNYYDIHRFNREHTEDYNFRVFSFIRWSDDEKLIIISNFDEDKNYAFKLKIPEGLISDWGLNDGDYQLKDQLFGKVTTVLKIENSFAGMDVKLDPLESLILRLDN